MRFTCSSACPAVPPYPFLISSVSPRKLSFSGNSLTSLPPELGQLTRLKELFISRNRLTALPNSLLTLTNLEKLSLARNELALNQLKPLVALSNLHNLAVQLNPIPVRFEGALETPEEIRKFFATL